MPTEEQTVGIDWTSMSGSGITRHGQRLFIINRIVSRLSFKLKKSGTPSGNVTLTIRKVSNDAILASKVLGDASGLPTTSDWQEVIFDSPVEINEEVRIQAEYLGTSSVGVTEAAGQVKSGEVQTQYQSGYTDDAATDGTYIYTYEELAAPAGVGGPAALIGAGII